MTGDTAPPWETALHALEVLERTVRDLVDDLRALCDRTDWRGNGHMVYARDVTRILDAYTGPPDLGPRVVPCPRCGASLHVAFPACPWCDWQPERGTP